MRKFLLFGVVLALLAVLAVPSFAQEEAPATLKVRVAHFSPDTPAVDVYVNGELSAITGLEFPNVTGWIELPAGTYNLAVAPAGTSIQQAAIGPADFELPAGAWITVAAVGSLSAGTLKPAIIVEDYSAIPAGSTRVTVFHGIEGAPAVDVYAGDSPVIRSLGFPGTRDGGTNDGAETLTVPGGLYDIKVTLFGRGTVVLDASNSYFDAGAHYLVAAVGTPDAPQAAVVATDPATGEMPAVRRTGAILTTTNVTSTLGDLLRRGGFTGGANTLNQPKIPVTVFAPVNSAFDKLDPATVQSVVDGITTTAVRDILLYHMASGFVSARDLAEKTELLMANGDKATISVGEDGSISINGAKVIFSKFGTNGWIHFIDSVLLPPTD